MATVAVNASLTVTFHGRKVGLVVAPGRFQAGRVVVADIGLELGATAALRATEAVLRAVPRRAPHDSKYTAGRVLVVGGSPGMTGAVCLAAEAALRADAGYVTVAVPREVLPVVEVRLLEPVKLGFAAEMAVDEILAAEDRADALALGPGLGGGDHIPALVRELLDRSTLPAVVDADALFGLEPIERSAPIVLTPHAGELARLLGETLCRRQRPPAGGGPPRRRAVLGRRPAQGRRHDRRRTRRRACRLRSRPAFACDRGQRRRAHRRHRGVSGEGDGRTSGGRCGCRRARHRRESRAGPGRPDRVRRRRSAAAGAGMRVELLGSGGATTVPRPGCRCRICVEARTRGVPYARTGPSVFVHGPDIVFDTPEEAKLQLDRAGDPRPSTRASTRTGTRITRWGGAVWETRNGDFLTWPRERKRPLVTDVYLPEQVAADFRTYLGGMAHLEFMQMRGWVRVHELADGESVVIGGVEVRPFRLSEDYVYAFELTARRSPPARGDGRAEPLGAAARGARASIWPSCPWASASSTRSPASAGSTPTTRCSGTRPRSRRRARSRVSLAAGHVVLHHVEEIDGLSHDDLQRLAPGYGCNVTFGWDGYTTDV